MPKTSKSKCGDDKNVQKTKDTIITNRTPSAWESIDIISTQTSKEKESKFQKIFSKNKKTPKNFIEQFGPVDIGPAMYHAFETRDTDKTVRSANGHVKEGIKKSASVDTFLTEKGTCDDDDDSAVIVYPCGTKGDAEKFGSKGNIIATLLSSDSSDSEASNAGDRKPTKKSKKTKIKSAGSTKPKEKKSKGNVETADVIYMLKDNKGNTTTDSLSEIPWVPVSYDPEMNHDDVIDFTLSPIQFVNLLSHPTFREDAVLIDLRSYEKYCEESVLGALHFSDFQDEEGLFTVDKVSNKIEALAIIITKKSDMDVRKDTSTRVFLLHDGGQSLKVQFPSLLCSQSNQSRSNWPQVSCFENGNLIFSEDFQTNIKWISKFNVDVILTNNTQSIRSEISQYKPKNVPSIISVRMTDATPADYSDKKIMDSDLMRIINELCNLLGEEKRCLIICKENTGLDKIILSLTLMVKNHWSLRDTINCVKYVRCQPINWKPNNLTILKSFEKCFFGKRLYSAGNKGNLNQDYAIVM